MLPLSSYFNHTTVKFSHRFLSNNFFFGFTYLTFFGLVLPMFPSFLQRLFLFFPSAMVINSLRGSERNGTSTTHLSAVNAQFSVNILWESLHYRLIKLLIKLSLLILLLAAILMNIHVLCYKSSRKAASHVLAKRVGKMLSSSYRAARLTYCFHSLPPFSLIVFYT